MKKKQLKRRENFAHESARGFLHPVLWSIYRNRGVMNSDELDYGLKHLLPFGSLKNIGQAVERLVAAIEQQQSIVIIGDYDVDGATSCALAMLGLKDLGAEKINFLVPNRFAYGYGLSPGIVDEAAEAFGPDLIITVDNGISSVNGVARAKELAIDVLITDHHLPGETVPEATCIVNPNQSGDDFPSKSLAGVGVMFYVLLALRSELEAKGAFTNKSKPNLANYLDLVALGTVADVVKLDRNNRILVDNGLRRIRVACCRPGISALIEVSGRNQLELSASDLGFALGPRINAAGRLDDISLGIHCLLADNKQQALHYARTLDDMNRERRLIEADMKAEAEQALNRLSELELAEQFGLSLYQEHWHQGVIGILASRVKETFERPCIIFADAGDGLLKGSGRSIQGLNIRDCLDLIDKRNPGLIVTFGGHAMAAGLSISKADFPCFQDAFNHCTKALMASDLPNNELISDGGLSEEDIGLDFAEILRAAGPWGQGFPEPLFDGVFYVISSRVLKEKHLKLILACSPQAETPYDAIWFNVPETVLHSVPERVHVAYQLSVNDYRGNKNVQLMIEHLCEWDYNNETLPA